MEKRHDRYAVFCPECKGRGTVPDTTMDPECPHCDAGIIELVRRKLYDELERRHLDLVERVAAIETRRDIDTDQYEEDRDSLCQLIEQAEQLTKSLSQVRATALRLEEGRCVRCGLKLAAPVTRCGRCCAEGR